ncbi:MAG: sulfatase-like hydrolase/transferase, partial [Chloroflexota bacterium]
MEELRHLFFGELRLEDGAELGEGGDVGASAGSDALPVTGYHIPLFIYSPKYIKPEKFSRLTSQIDLAPTILGLLHFNYRS